MGLRDLCVVAQNSPSVADYFTQIKRMWDDYNSMVSIPHCSCGITCASLIATNKLIKDQQLMQFLACLNNDYKVIRDSILMMKPLPSIDTVYQLIVQEEKQRPLSTLSQINNNAASFNASKINNHTVLAAQQRDYNNTNQLRSYSFNSGYKSNQQFGYNHANGQNHYNGYNPKIVPKPSGQVRRQFFCDHCKVAGHTIQRCYKNHRYPPGHKLYRGRKMAATVVHSDSTAGFTQELSCSQASTTALALTSEQYSQLMKLLSKHC